MAARVRLVSILSLSHSGSTLLDLLLNAHSRFASVGELKKFYPRILQGDRYPCTCGEKPLEGCSFWRPVVDRLVSTGRSLHDIRTDRFGAKSLPCNEVLLHAIAEETGGAVVVDSSKTVRRFEQLARSSELEILPVFLVRDPRGQVCSTLRKGEATLVEAIRHYNRNSRRIVRAIGTHPHVVVRYEDLARNPEEAIAPILSYFGERFEAAQLNWATMPKHSLAGNRMRHGVDSTIRADESWRSSLPVWQRAAVQAGTWNSRRLIDRCKLAAAE